MINSHVTSERNLDFFFSAWSKTINFHKRPPALYGHPVRKPTIKTPIRSTRDIVKHRLSDSETCKFTINRTKRFNNIDWKGTGHGTYNVR